MQRMWIGCLAALLLPYVVTLAWSGGVGGVSGDGMTGGNRYDGSQGEYHGSIYLSGEKKGYLDVETYLVGVVARQIPADYEPEALKAQAIIARTYIYRQMDGRDGISEEELGLSCLEESQMESLWGSRRFVEYYEKISQAVKETAGMVLVLEGEGNGDGNGAGNGEEFPEPLFHRASAGFTRQGDEAHSYLQSVDSRWDMEAEGYLTIMEWEPGEAVKLLKEAAAADGEELSLTEGQVMETLQLVGRDSAGYVNEIQIGAHIYTGDEVRVALGLPSAAFTLETHEEKIRAVCKGIGHGYGFSQYGGNAMAKEGKSAQEILNYYYQNIAIISLGS